QDADAEGSQRLIQAGREGCIAVMKEKVVPMISGDPFPKLLQCPRCTRMRSDIAMQDSSGPHLHHHEHVKHAKSGRDGHQEITSDDRSCVIADESLPVM